MPNWGANPKKQEAREKLQQEKVVKRSMEEEAKEASKWVEKDKQALTQLERKKQTEEKAALEQQKKLEKKRLYEEDQAQFVSSNKKPVESIKMTRAQIEEQKRIMLLKSLQKSMGITSITKDDENEETKSDNSDYEKAHSSDYDDLEENPNRLEAEQDALDKQQYSEVIKATGINEALEKLDVKTDKHPEKRMKAAFGEYVEQQLPLIKRESPSLKRSQLMEIIKKNWKKAPENPFNQTYVGYNEKIKT